MHDDITPGRKGQQNSRLMSPSARFSKYHIAKPSKLTRPVRVFETSHLASSTSLSSLTVRSDKGPTNEPGVFRRFDCPITECQSRTCLVFETQPRCKRQSLQTNGRWSQKESLQHINYLELKASFLALKTFVKGKSRVPYLYI